MPNLRQDIQQNIKRANHVVSVLPLKLGDPFLSLSFGTQIGFGLRFTEKKKGSLAELNEQKLADIQLSDEEDGYMGKALHSLMTVAQKAGTLERFREEHMHAGLIIVSATVGVVIPSLSASVYLDRDGSK